MTAPPRPSSWPSWVAALVTVAGSAAWIASIASCHPPTPRPPGAPPARTPNDTVALARLYGTWEWRLEGDQPGVHKIEHERWRFDADPAAPPDAPRAIGAYDRDVEIRSTDGTPFVCDEDGSYHQRARFRLRAEAAGGVVTVTETGYDAEPSPCDHGFRRAGSYTAVTRGDRTTLRWDGGSQVLTRVADQPLPAAPPWPAARPTWNGPWTWTARTMDDDGNFRDEREDWQLAVGADSLASATYVRTVTITSVDDRPLTCSGTRRWTYVDRYVLDGHAENGLLTLTEVAVDAGTHPCLATSPRRALDGLTAELDGEYVVLEWRGKRRQVLHRPR
jgi:hypothetical protein